MPQQGLQSKWFVRITLPHILIKEKMSMVCAWVDLQKILWVTHVGDKTEKEHCHFVLELSSELQKQSLLARIKKIYGVSGNEQLSAKPWDGNSDACSYLFHDPNAEIITNKGYSPEQITEFRTRNEFVQKIVEENRKRASGRCVDRALRAIEAGEITRDSVKIAIYILKLIRDGEMYEPGDFMIKRYIEEIMSKSVSGADWERYAVSRAEKLFPEWT